MKRLLAVILLALTLAGAVYAEAGITMSTGFSVFTDSGFDFLLPGVYFDYGGLADITKSGSLKFDAGLHAEVALEPHNTDMVLFRTTLCAGLMVKTPSPIILEFLPSASWILIAADRKTGCSAFDFTVGGIVNFAADLGRGEMVLLAVGTDMEYGLVEKRLYCGFSCGVRFYI